MATKSILLSIQPKWVAKILNGEKTIEIRKKFPKNYVGWVYIYCTKGKGKLFRCKLHAVHNIDGTGMHNQYETYTKYGVAKNLDIFQDNIHENVQKQLDITDSTHGELDLYDYVEEFEWEDDELNGKVVARFWCDKVEEIDKDNLDGEYWKEIEYWKDEACLTYEELRSYLKGKKGYAIHITKLEIFNKPKDISEFKKIDYIEEPCGEKWEKWIKHECLYPLTRAPQSWCYVEVQL
jgi:predicted transcriptional regulator